jgi:hypothetical protein
MESRGGDLSRGRGRGGGGGNGCGVEWMMEGTDREHNGSKMERGGGVRMIGRRLGGMEDREDDDRSSRAVDAVQCACDCAQSASGQPEPGRVFQVSWIGCNRVAWTDNPSGHIVRCSTRFIHSQFQGARSLGPHPQAPLAPVVWAWCRGQARGGEDGGSGRILVEAVCPVMRRKGCFPHGGV